jgi:antitoxin HicB
VPRTLHEKLKFVAAREGVSLNAYVAEVLAKAWDGRRAKI